jgi:hypothetical protein
LRYVAASGLIVALWPSVIDGADPIFVGRMLDTGRMLIENNLYLSDEIHLILSSWKVPS